MKSSIFLVIYNGEVQHASSTLPLARSWREGFSDQAWIKEMILDG